MSEVVASNESQMVHTQMHVVSRSLTASDTLGAQQTLVETLGGMGPEPTWRVGEFLPFTAPALATLSSSVRPSVLGAPTRSPVHTSATMLNVGTALPVGFHL